MNVTSDKVEISVGLRVFTNDWSWGTVIEAPSEYDNDGWWKVKIDDDAEYCAGQTKSYNGERMAVRAPLNGKPDPHPAPRVPLETMCQNTDEWVKLTFYPVPRRPYQVAVKCPCGDVWHETHNEEDVKYLLMVAGG